MTHGQRQAHLKRLSSIAVVSNQKAPRSSSLALVKEVDLSDKPCCSRQLFPPTQPTKEAQSQGNLSVSVEQFSDSMVILIAVLAAIWRKAGELLSDSKAICAVPGGQSKDRMVKSSSSLAPHVVTADNLANTLVMKSVRTGNPCEFAHTQWQLRRTMANCALLWTG